MPRIVCPGCGGVLPLSDAQVGRRIECGRCGRVFTPRDDRDDETDPDDEFDDDLPPDRRPVSGAGNRAIASLVIGAVALTLSVALFCCPFVALPLGVTAVVLGVSGQRSEFPGLAIAGIVTGALATLLSAALSIWFGLAIWLK